MQAAGKVGRAGTVCLQFWGQREEAEWGLGGEGRVHGDRVSVGEDGTVLAMEGGCGCTAL